MAAISISMHVCVVEYLVIHRRLALLYLRLQLCLPLCIDFYPGFLEGLQHRRVLNGLL